MEIERSLVAVVAKYVCGKSVVQRVLVAVVSKVVNLICDYLVRNRCCKGCKVSILTLSYRKGLGGRVCMWEIGSFFTY